ncbi:PhoP regulatory network YrbL family protein [Alphaproteobacteria bacterium]|nr:PhoP regulatory network YrbL family protein [Alphaproteobacteria bacterium]
MVDLSKSVPFAEGGRRICYQHPENPDLCIKVSKPDTIITRRANMPLHRRLRPLSAFDDNHDEIKGYRQLVVKRAVGDENAPLWQHVPKCYGFVETNIGLGLVSDFYHTHNKPAPTVQQLLYDNGLTPELQAALDEFAQFLSDSLLVTRAIIPHNIVFAADGRIKLIDGIGGRNLIPIAEFFPFPSYNIFAKRKAQKRIKDMWVRVNDRLSRRG